MLPSARPRHGHPQPGPARRRLAVAPVAHGRCPHPYVGRAAQGSLRHDQLREPAEARPAQLADKAGLTLIELALAFVINHPAVTPAIIGPRTMEQPESQLPVADVALTADFLDRIDELVAPGVTINPHDNNYSEAEFTPAARRRKKE